MIGLLIWACRQDGTISLWWHAYDISSNHVLYLENRIQLPGWSLTAHPTTVSSPEPLPLHTHTMINAYTCHVQVPIYAVSVWAWFTHTFRLYSSNDITLSQPMSTFHALNFTTVHHPSHKDKAVISKLGLACLLLSFAKWWGNATDRFHCVINVCHPYLN